MRKQLPLPTLPEQTMGISYSKLLVHSIWSVSIQYPTTGWVYESILFVANQNLNYSVMICKHEDRRSYIQTGEQQKRSGVSKRVKNCRYWDIELLSNNILCPSPVMQHTNNSWSWRSTNLNSFSSLFNLCFVQEIAL